MKPVTTIGVFAFALAAVFTGGAVAGRALEPRIEPLGEPVTDHRSGSGDDHGASLGAGDDATTDPQGSSGVGAPRDVPGGVMVSAAGYRLQLAAETVPASPAATMSFTILRQDGSALQDFTPAHGKELHLIVVRRDLGGYQHLHPVRDSAGTWSSPVNLSVPGAYRVFADFVPAAGDPVTLGADLAVPGDYRPIPLAPATATATVGDYTVRLTGRLAPGQDSPVTLSVLRNGTPVSDLEPYLGAYGHMVALRAGDLAYLHVHPAGHPGDGNTLPGPRVDFAATVPSTGTYRLYFDFKHRGVVRTAEFTVPAGATSTRGASPTPAATPTPGTTGHTAASHAH
ncbi:hypothetical protein [Humibacillus xanthopallidus]|uniref:Secreted protein n=1 Tax=Humibacillus xanthopallidus TaxID=412689 RepID=A0A543HHY1_9MICO|nr:hypothetical protein [Humibacillus xanthopallidus]TQM57943.1 hypothetical protein FBY41_3295 [Humibacillus xanthopallidus]